MISVVIADDHQLFRAGLLALLSVEHDIKVVGQASDGHEAIALARQHGPDVVIMDIRMPSLDGVAATRLITADKSTLESDRLARVLVLTTYRDDQAVYGALQGGASGYLLKSAAPQDLVNAIRHVANGDGWIDQNIASMIINALARVPRSGDNPSRLVHSLTPREREVLTLMAQGMTNSEIKESLVLSEATVKTHVAHIIAKTGSRDRTQAVVLAYQNRLVLL
jgi:DNA-binding NarL/FixJ family response regulator